MTLSTQPAPPAESGIVRGLTRLWMPMVGGAARTGLPLAERVWRARGYHDETAATKFLAPSLTHLHDPSLMPGLDRAAQRILSGAINGERIVIYGDYDVDGVTATAILHHTLRLIAPTARVSSYVPHRLEEGYGLSAQSVQELCDQGAQLIVSVDCGVTAFEPARVAKAAGVDLIITDHHNLPEAHQGLPEAFAVVHPRLPGSAYPFGELCGAGVAFKLAWRLMTLAHGGQKLPQVWREMLLELLGLCALGVIADVVPLVDENRVIARFGLVKIKHSAIPGLAALVEASGLAGENVQADDVGFKLGPRLNACGRMGHAREAVELLTTATGERAIEIAEQLSRQNTQRQATERAIFVQASEMAVDAGMTGVTSRAIILAHPEWHAGVVGIVCSRLVERFARPTILLREADGMCHGSGRSIDGYSLHAGLASCAAHLSQFGGHDMAAGMKLASVDLPAFREAFFAHARDALSPDDLVHKTRYDTIASLRELTPETVFSLQKLAPFGRENPPVRLMLAGVVVKNRPTLMGGTGKHVAVLLGAEDGTGPIVRAVAWNWADRVEHFALGARMDVLATPKINEWNGKKSVEIELVDARPG